MIERPTPLPMTILAGFLGSGKTTLVNHLLREAEQRILVMVNDFGDIAIDEDLIRADDGQTLTLANGCACCSMGADLYAAFDQALSFDPPPDQLLIEASGVADPKKLANLAMAEPDLRLNAIITLVDAENFQQSLGDSRISDIVAGQVGTADIILLNKCDLVDADTKTECIDQIRHLKIDARIIETSHATISGRILFDPQLEPTSAAEGSNINPAHVHGDIFQSWHFHADDKIDKTTFMDLLKTLPQSVIRFKGIFRQPQNDWIAIHRVGARISTDPLPDYSAGTNAAGFVAIGLKNSDFEQDMQIFEAKLRTLLNSSRPAA